MPAIIAQPGMPIWIDLATSDVAAAQRFYGELLGWEFDEDSEGRYVVATRSGMPVAGIASVPQSDISVWGVSLYTPDVAQAHQGAVEAGATEILPPMDVSARGQMTVIVDPCGAAVGLRCPADEHALLAAGEPGTPVWFELMVGQNWAETARFYHELAGWDIRETVTDMRYGTGEVDGAAVAGMWDTSDLEGSPSMWTVYMGVADVDEACARVQELGGSVVREPWNSEFGRMAAIQDPTGALLNLCAVEEYVPSDEEAHEPDLFDPENPFGMHQA